MEGFVANAAQQYMHSGQPSGQGRGQGQGPGYGAPHPQGAPHPPPGRGPPPPHQDPNHGLPPGWIAEWNASDNRWFYVNQRSRGQTTWNRPPTLPPGWLAEWDAPDNRFFFVNERTGERTWNPPGGAPHPAPPTQVTQTQRSGQAPGGYNYQQTQTVTQTPAPAAKNHNLAYGAAGAVGGLAAGALLMHEGHKVGKSAQNLAGTIAISSHH